MTITLDLPPETEARLRDAASVGGLPVTDYLRHFIERLPGDPFLLALALAPKDDELETDDEREAVQDAWDAVSRGESIPLDEISL